MAIDNDTFPLWYNHEVEGVRTDTRVVNMEYLQTDWYIDQMKRQAYDSPPLPISLSHEDYKEGRMEYVPIDTDSIAIGPATISLKGKQGLFKNELMVLDMLLQANWERHSALPARPLSTRRTRLSYFSYGYESKDRRGEAL